MAKHYLEQVLGRAISAPEAGIMTLRVPIAGTLEKVTIYVNGVVTTTNTFDANLNGTTVFPTQADRPSITSGNQSDENGGTLSSAVVVGDKLTIDVDVVGEEISFITVIFQIEDGVSSGSTLAGDVTGSSSANTVEKIRSRTVKAFAPPSYLADNFGDGVLNTNSLWTLSGDNSTYMTETETGGQLRETSANNSFFKHRKWVTVNNYNFSNKEVIFDIGAMKYDLGDGSIGGNTKHFFGIYESGSNFSTGGIGSTNDRPTLFIGFRIGDGVIKACFEVTGNGNNLASAQATTADTIANLGATKLKMVDSGGVMYFYAYQSGAYVQIYSHDYSASSIGTSHKLGFSTGFSANSMGDYIYINDISTTAVLSDELSDGDLLTWNSLSQYFEAKSLGVWDPNKAQSSPNSFDDDFTGSALNGKWTTFGSADVALSVHSSLLQIKQVSQASYKLSGIYQTIPSGDWEAVALIGLKSDNANNYAAGGIALLETDGATGRIQAFELYQTAASIRAVQDELWTNRTTFGSTTAAASTTVNTEPEMNMFRFLYVRVQKSGTNYRTFWSRNGFTWVPNGAAHALAFTPTKLGLVMYNNGTTVDVSLLCDFIRVYSTMPDVIGGAR